MDEQETSVFDADRSQDDEELMSIVWVEEFEQKCEEDAAFMASLEIN